MVEAKLDGDIDNFKTRKIIFDTTNMMTLIVVDKSWGTVKFYYRGIESCTKVSMRDLRTSSKKDNTDVNSILKAFIEGKAPTL